VPMIREVIVTTIGATGETHLAPLGLIESGGEWIIAPFRPSTTLDNLKAVPFAVANHTDDPLLFAGLVTGRKNFPLVPTKGPVPRLAGALAHAELGVARIEEDQERPRFFCKILHRGQHAPFEGFNRARNAILEAAILITRLHLLPREKVDREIAYLAIAIEKTAGEREREAWSWLMEKRDVFYAEGN
jgi:hypothetical protein